MNVLVLALLLSSAQEPMAVAPWRNLNDDDSLEWLEQGAAETMSADLKRAGVSVVERAQISEALAQVKAREEAREASDDVTRAVAVGKLVGARAMVVGSFQRSAGQIRLVARVVDVETGVVEEAAKATGALDDIFDLQDRIVAALAAKVGKSARLPAASVGGRVPSPPKKKRPQAAQAYERFSRSLTATTHDDQRALLDEALRLDPDLVYARDALAALEARLRRSAEVSAGAFGARETELLKIVEDTAQTADRRQQAATVLLDTLDAARRYHALLRASERVLAAHLPGDVLHDPSEHASAARVLALSRLVRVDAGLQAGERHLAAFPAGARRARVEELVRELVEDRRSLPERRREYEQELADHANDVEEARAKGRTDAETLASHAWKPCVAAKWSRLPDEMLANCTRYLAAFPQGHMASSARAFIAWAHAMKGEWPEARQIAERLEADVPGALDDTGLRSLIEQRWSTD